MSEKLLDLIWSLDIEKMNDHLPTERKTLKELLEDENPIVMTKKNNKHRIKKKDLEFISNFFPKEEWTKVKFPIILLRRTSMEKGLYSISGGIHEIYAVYRTIGKTKQSFHRFKLDEHKPYIWKPETFTAIRKASSIFIVGYS